MKNILDLANSCVGIKEGTAEHRNIVDTYNTIIPLPVGYSVKYTDNWCCAFISYLFKQCNCLDLIAGGECGVERLVGKAKAKGIWIEDGKIIPKVGDIIVYDWQRKDGWADHIGIVNKVGDFMEVIEGNYYNSVKVRGVTFGDSVIKGFIRPKYNTEETPLTKYSQGIDVSANQGNIDWKKVKDAGVEFAIIRATTRNNNVDAMMPTYVKGCIDNEIPFDFYKYSYAMTEKEAEIEAKRVLEEISKCGIKEPKGMCIWLDLEHNPQLALPQQSLINIVNVYRRVWEYEGFEFGIYTGKYAYETNPEINNFLDYDIWIARYYKGYSPINFGFTPDKSYIPELQGGKSIWGWQFTSSGKVIGIQGNVDLNEVYGKRIEMYNPIISLEYFETPTYALTMLLASIGVYPSKANKELIAKANGIPFYTETIEQDLILTQLLQEGKLIKPDGVQLRISK